MLGPTTNGAFSSEDLLPGTGNPSPDTSQANMVRLAARDADGRSIYVQNPTHRPVFKALDMVLSLGAKGACQTGVGNAAPSYAGKSASADELGRISL